MYIDMNRDTKVDRHGFIQAPIHTDNTEHTHTQVRALTRQRRHGTFNIADPYILYWCVRLFAPSHALSLLLIRESMPV